jgi:hypothetical protein
MPLKQEAHVRLHITAILQHRLQTQYGFIRLVRQQLSRSANIISISSQDTVHTILAYHITRRTAKHERVNELVDGASV